MAGASAGMTAGTAAAGATASGAAGDAAAAASPTVNPQVPTTVEQLNEILSAGNPAVAQQLADLMEDLSSSEILFALILAAAMQKKDDDESGGGGGALGVLAGIALAAEIGRSFASEFGGAAPVTGAEGAAGGQLNLQA